MSKTNGIATASDEGSRLLERRLAAQLLNQYALGELDTLEGTDPDIFPSPDLRQLVRAMKDGQSYSDILIGPLQSTALELEDDYKITARSSQLLTVLEDGWIAREIERAVRLSEGAETGRGKLQALRAHLDQIEARTATTATAVWFPTPDNRPEETEPIITLHGSQVLSAGNVSGIVSMPSFGKTNLCGGIAAAAINPNCDSFGFGVPAGTTVLYVDTEQSQLDHWRAADRARRRAGVDKWPTEYNVHFALFALEPRVDKRVATLHRMIDDLDAKLVIVDGLGDFVRDANDATEVNDFIFSLTAKAKQRNLGILGTIHPNPSGDRQKARGHLGSEVMRRSETVLLIEKNPDDTRTIHTRFNYGKTRNTHGNLSSSFAWSDEYRMFVSCGGPDPGAEKRRVALSALLKLIDGPITYPDLVKAIMEETDCGERTAKTRIKDMQDANLIAYNASKRLEQVDTDDIPF